MKINSIHILIILILSIVKKNPLTLITTHSIKNSNYEVIKIIPKDESIYTQGLFYSNDSKYLYESGGLYKKSVLIQYLYPYMIKEREIRLDNQYFAEGIAVCYSNSDNHEVLYQLTYRERVILKYSYPSLDYIGTIAMDKSLREGWGLSLYSNNNQLIATDGSDSIFVLSCDNNNLSVSDTIKVTYPSVNGNNPSDRLNELIYANEAIYANRYFDNSIYKISPHTGQVIKSYDMSQLALNEITNHKLTHTRLNRGDVLNGIAYDHNANLFLLTGKLWSNYYLIKFLA